jgi:hypothetical protein
VFSTGKKRNTIENSCEVPRKIIKHTLEENSLDGNNSTIQVRDENVAKRNVYNTRGKTMLKIPKSILFLPGSFDVHNA